MAKLPSKKRVTNLKQASNIVKNIDSNTKTSDTNKSVSSTIDDAEQEKLNSKKRVKLTTMINPSLRDKLKLIAIKKRVNFSDILEDAIKDYLK